jgi:hypothetical protein
MKIKWVKNGSGIGYGFMEGTEVDVTESFGHEIIELGYAVMVHSKPTSLPENLPGRKILIENGFVSVGEIQQLTADELTTIKGIGKKLAEAIFKFINE